MKQLVGVGVVMVTVACVGEPEVATDETSSELSVPELGYYCSTVFPGGGWTFVWSANNPCSGSSGGKVVRAGVFINNSFNRVDLACDGLSQSFVGMRDDALRSAFDVASQNRSNCVFTVTMGSTPRVEAPAPIVGCANGASAQSFGTFVDASGTSHTVVGCPGHVTFADRASLCAPTWTPTSSTTWAGLSSTSVPTHDYWTADSLGWVTGGASGSCSASMTGNTCSGNGAMHVCTTSGGDGEGNTCTWTGCGLDTTTNQFFGGCSTTAGTLCEQITPPPAFTGGCADGSVEQNLGNYRDGAGVLRMMVGCAGTTTWDQRGSLCAPGWSPASAADWSVVSASSVPSHHYWTNDELGYTGTGSSSCNAAPLGTPRVRACAALQPMHVCKPSLDDPEGNHCNWVDCGFGIVNGASMGGCGATAGTLCQRRWPGPLTINPVVPLHDFDLAAFESDMHDAMSAAHPRGWELAIVDPSGATIHQDHAGLVTGDGTSLTVPMTDDRRLDTASMSKTVTAAGVMAAFEDMQSRGVPVTLDSSIAPYLPSNWTKHPAITSITFRMLLQHRAGLNTCTSNRYGDLGTMVQNGPILTGNCAVGTQCYSNCNYALLRIATSYLVESPGAMHPFEADIANNDKVTSLSYRNYLRAKLFDPLGMSAADVVFTGSDRDSMYFHTDFSSCPTPDPDTNILTAGPGTWTVSATEYARFLSGLRRNVTISSTSWNAMRTMNLGTWAHGGKLGTYLDHNGGGGVWNGASCGPTADWMVFPDGHVGVFISNTANAGGSAALGYPTWLNNFDAAVTLK
jgi:CubicO group peptidase (beta-lactamase class C family)